MYACYIDRCYLNCLDNIIPNIIDGFKAVIFEFKISNHKAVDTEIKAKKVSINKKGNNLMLKNINQYGFRKSQSISNTNAIVFGCGKVSEVFKRSDFSLVLRHKRRCSIVSRTVFCYKI